MRILTERCGPCANVGGISDLPQALSLFAKGVMVEQADPAAVSGDLLPPEAKAIARAVDKRRIEYTAGRVLGRRALARLGFEAFPIVNGADRAPIWPAGIVGSIAHTEGLCVVAVARAAQFAAVGVDVEPDEALADRLWSRVLTDVETRFLEQQPEAERGRLGRLFFSAKECFYKCQYPLTRTFLGFHDVSLEVDTEAGTFVARLTRAAGSVFTAGDTVGGRFARGGGHVVTAISLPQQSPLLHM